MKITHTFEHIRSIYGPCTSDGAAYCQPRLFGGYIVDYGNSYWPSHSYWMVPGIENTFDHSE